jgi:alanine-glyoxylate transaminase/(R)-3-amino-2-methylpropionate-pyruvate transaminase
MSQTLTNPAGASAKTGPRKISLPVCNHKPSAYSGPSKAEVIDLRQQYLSPGLIRYYKDPLMIVEGNMQYVWDETGKRYLDGFAGIVTVSVGHSHPKVVKAAQDQLSKLTHTTTIYLHPTIGLYAKKLTEHMPAGSNLSNWYFTNSGSEANELAILAGREFTKNADVVSLRNAYHGGTAATMNLTAHGTWKFKSTPGFTVKNATPGYCYRCPYGLTYPSCNLKCAHDLKDLIEYETSGEIAVFIAECIQGVGGAVVPPKEYFKIVYDIARKHGAICVADEVQGGFGRTGTKFWAFENWDVVPDAVTMAKGIGNGAPLAAFVTRPEISKTLTNRIHFNTYGGNPVSMAQGLATLEVIDDEQIQQKALNIGGHLKGRLTALQQKHSMIGDVRGMGLMLGVELVKDRTSKEPAKAEAATVVELAKERGLLLGKGGLHGNVLRIKPPMCLSKDDADFIADCLDEVLPMAVTP